MKKSYKFKSKDIPQKEMFKCFSKALSSADNSSSTYTEDVIKAFESGVDELKLEMTKRLNEIFEAMDIEVEKAKEYLVKEKR